MALLAIPLNAVFADDVVESIEDAIVAKLRELLAESERQHRANEWQSVRQMAAYLQISEAAVRKRAARGRLEVKRHGRRLLVRLGSA